jgi:hypothetical protein
MLCFIGVRHLVNAEPDPDWILRPDTLKVCRSWQLEV